MTVGGTKEFVKLFSRKLFPSEGGLGSGGLPYEIHGILVVSLWGVNFKCLVSLRVKLVPRALFPSH